VIHIVPAFKGFIGQIQTLKREGIAPLATPKFAQKHTKIVKITEKRDLNDMQG